MAQWESGVAADAAAWQANMVAMGHLPRVVWDDAAPVLQQLLPKLFQARAPGTQGTSTWYNVLATAALAAARVNTTRKFVFLTGMPFQKAVPAPGALDRVLSHVTGAAGFPIKDYGTLERLVASLWKFSHSLPAVPELYLEPDDFVSTQTRPVVPLHAPNVQWVDLVHIGNLADDAGRLQTYGFILWTTWPYMLVQDQADESLPSLVYWTELLLSLLKAEPAKVRRGGPGMFAALCRLAKKAVWEDAMLWLPDMPEDKLDSIDLLMDFHFKGRPEVIGKQPRRILAAVPELQPLFDLALSQQQAEKACMALVACFLEADLVRISGPFISLEVIECIAERLDTRPIVEGATPAETIADISDSLHASGLTKQPVMRCAQGQPIMQLWSLGMQVTRTPPPTLPHL